MKISIIKVEPINFTLKNNQEKESITRTFQKFLNSLDFPIQIVVATDTLNLDTYLSKLEEKADKYATILEDFRKHLQKMILSEKLLNRFLFPYMSSSAIVSSHQKSYIKICNTGAVVHQTNLQMHRLEHPHF